MAYEHKPGSFSLFKNERKTADNQPDYRGEGKDISGANIEVAAWLKESAKGKFMSCTFKPASARTQQPEKQQPTGRSTDGDDETPF